MARILLVDDEEPIRMALSQALQDEGHTITEAPNGVDCLRLYNTERHDLVITDILMPDQEGLQTIMMLRKICPDVKIVVISGGARVNSVNFLEIAKKLGADAILQKPFSIDDLFRAVNTCLGETV
jgi:CheY-like chemotaxis protein